MRVVASAIALLIAALPSFAQERLSIDKSLGVLRCLRGLDGYQVVVKVSGADQIINKAFEFGSAQVRWIIARNISVLTEVEQAANTSRNQMIKELSEGMGEIKQGTPAAQEFTLQWETLLQMPTALSDKLARIKLSDLKLDKNEIPGTVLAGCMPIIDP